MTSPPSSSVLKSIVTDGVLLEESGSKPEQGEARRQELVKHFDIDKLPLDAGDYTYFPDPNLHEDSWIDIVGWWAEFTSIHGVYYAFERGHLKPWKQYIWALFTFGCFAAMVATVVVMIQEFAEYKLSTSIQTVNNFSLSFPQVTLCNTNSFDVVLQQETGIVEPIDEAELRAISQPLDEFILLSSFNKRSLVINETWTPIITSFGQCYSFQTDDKVFRPGSDAGLQVTAWLNQDHYQNSTIEAGIRIFVTQPKTQLISDQTAQTLVGTGTSAYLHMQLTDYKREQQQPWSRCSAEIVNNEQCRTQCKYETIQNFCKCRSIGDPNGGLQYCNSTTIAPFSSINVTDDGSCEVFRNDNTLADCFCETPPCSEQKYDVSYSGASISKSFTQQVESLVSLPSGSVSENLVCITINYGTIQHEEFQESKSTSFSQLISDLGGQLGFFMGISIISVAELFIELFGLRLLPRFLFGNNKLYGLGQKQD